MLHLQIDSSRFIDQIKKEDLDNKNSVIPHLAEVIGLIRESNYKITDPIHASNIVKQTKKSK